MLSKYSGIVKKPDSKKTAKGEGIMRFGSLGEALNYARDKEQAACDLYTTFKTMVKNTAAKKLLEDLASQELGHKKMIENALASGTTMGIGGKKNIAELSFSDYMLSTNINADSSPQDVMTFAMKMEQAAYELYTGLLDNYGGTELETLFTRLAREELKHKEILEEQYEKHFMQWM